LHKYWSGSSGDGLTGPTGPTGSINLSGLTLVSHEGPPQSIDDSEVVTLVSNVCEAGELLVSGGWEATISGEVCFTETQGAASSGSH
jgi:hypothetical protein